MDIDYDSCVLNDCRIEGLFSRPVSEDQIRAKWQRMVRKATGDLGSHANLSGKNGEKTTAECAMIEILKVQFTSVTKYFVYD